MAIAVVVLLGAFPSLRASDLACIGFDRSGTTRIGKFIINHSFIVPGLIGVGTGCLAGFLLVKALF